MRRWMGLCVALLVVCSWADGQTTATGTVRGRVICQDTQQPARLAHVVLQPLVDLKSPVLNSKDGEYRTEGVFHLQTVGLDGSFVIQAVPPGLYYVIAERDGYVSPLTIFTRDDLNHPDEAMMRKISRYMTPISVAAGRMTQAQVNLVRGATIAGSVHFEDGAPAAGVSMAVLQRDAKGIWKQVRTGHIAGQ